MIRTCTNTIVVGDGLTAVFAAGLLQSIGGVDASLIPAPVDPARGSLRPLVDPALVIPVFPSLDDTWFSRHLKLLAEWPPTPLDPAADLLRVSHRFADSAMGAHPADGTAAPGSYAEQARGVSLTQAYKQFGQQLCTTAPLLELQAKVRRHYPNSGDRPGRVGFLRGECAYAHLARTVGRDLAVATSRCAHINHDLREVQLEDGRRLEYDSLVFCGSLGSLSSSLGVSGEELVGAPAVFMTCSIPAGGLPPNCLVYDYRQDSPILRVFVPAEGRLLVQLTVNMPIDRYEVRLALESLLDLRPGPLRGPSILEGAYPLEPRPAETATALNEACELGGITRFGRYAEWRYVDLHELEWERLMELTCTTG